MFKPLTLTRHRTPPARSRARARARRGVLLLGCGLVAALPGCRRDGSPSHIRQPARAAPDAPAYDLAPLLRSLRPGAAAELKAQVGVKDLTDLPLYDMHLKLHDGGQQISGRYTLYYLNRTGRALPDLPLILHANAPRELGGPPESSEVRVTGARALRGPQLSVAVERPTLVRLRFQRPVRPGERIKLEVRFEGRIRQLPPGSNDLFNQALASLGMASAGAKASDYGLLAAGDGLITVASAYPMVAPFRRGEFDVRPPGRFGDLAYNDVSHFKVEVQSPRGYAVVTNLHDSADPAAIAAAPDVHRAVGAANRDFVLVAGAGLSQRSRTVDDVRVTSWYVDADREAGARVLETAAQSLALFQSRYGAYPYRELDVAEATLVGGAGGVEFPGMVLIAGMLYRPPSRSSNPMAQLLRLAGGLTSAIRGALGGGGAAPQGGMAGRMTLMDGMIEDMAAFTVAHEVAHQFFAGVVGTDCRNDPAVDEPLAQHAAGELLRHLRGADEGQRLMDLNVKLNYGLYRLLGGKDMPAAQPVDGFPSPLAYAAIVYGKAPYFYLELERALGAAKLRTAMRRAVDANRFRIVDLDGWVDALARGAGDDAPRVRQLARRWFYQTHGDADLGLDASGEAALAQLVGAREAAELKRSLAPLGMSPADLFRTLLGGMMQ